MQVPRLFMKEATEAAAGPATRAPKPIAARAVLGLEVEDVKKLPDGECGGGWSQGMRHAGRETWVRTTRVLSRRRKGGWRRR